MWEIHGNTAVNVALQTCSHKDQLCSRGGKGREGVDLGWLGLAWDGLGWVGLGWVGVAAALSFLG